MHRSRASLYYVYIAIFALSGFSGLIYESIWSHYLKLFLGHAAYAQVLVLAIFMGGMAIGSALTARLTNKIKNLLLVYAVIELVLGFGALLFHRIFVGVVDFSFQSILPFLEIPFWVHAAKWIIASLLILPQCILLGSTFPLLSGGLLRRFPQDQGRSLCLLYFSNSMGAVIGVLTSGFVLIAAVGLPGTILTAGLINIVIALIVWFIQKSDAQVESSFSSAQSKHTASHQRLSLNSTHKILLCCAAITGMASFMYEIAWLRMLAMVIGSSTHAFELMLSAFILGLALGGLWIHKRLDSDQHPITTLAIIQIAMGLLAILTLPLYNQTFDLMAWLMTGFTKTEEGYLLFNLGSHLIAMLMMLPTTFCAGMTLPLITHILLKQNGNQSAIGATYAFNTLGSILGIAIAVLLLMPLVGVKGVLSIGAILDIGLGLALILFINKSIHYSATGLRYGLLALFSVVFIAYFTDLDIAKMSSGVYRHGEKAWAAPNNIIFHRDGKTATVHVVSQSGGTRYSLRTNGKPDAGVEVNLNAQPAADEATMLLLGALPLLINPTAEQAAVIGLGAGVTSHVVLTSPTIKNMTTIEIEPAIVEAGQYFRDRATLVFADPRSHIVIEDAKTYFNTQKQKYDIIISEPSNPWVSGVSSLFTDEFYKQVKPYLNTDGVFVQWLHIYEMNNQLLKSVFKALDDQFADYRIYSVGSDLIVVAVSAGKVPELQESALQFPLLNKELSRFNLSTINSLQSHYVAEKSLVSWLVKASTANSDFFPLLDQGAVKQRFYKSTADIFTRIRENPLIQMVPGINANLYITSTDMTADANTSTGLGDAVSIFNYVNNTNNAKQGLYASEKTEQNLFNMLATINTYGCRETMLNHRWMSSFKGLMNASIPFLSSDDGRIVYNYFYSMLGSCISQLSAENRDWLLFYKALLDRDANKLSALAEKILPQEGKIEDSEDGRLLINALLVSSLRTGAPNIDKINTYTSRYAIKGEPDAMSTILSHMLILKVDQNK